MMPTREVTTRRRVAHGPAFTLIELLVAISIISLLVGISFPILSKLNDYGRGKAGVTTVSVAVNAARMYSQRMPTKYSADHTASGFPYPVGADYSGTAALFTPAHEIRLVVNDQAATDTGLHDSTNWQRARLEWGGRTVSNTVPPKINGYTDYEPVDPIRLPDSAGILGVIRTGPGPYDLRLITPPFAVCFDQHGQIVVPPMIEISGSFPPEDFLYYDGDEDRNYETDRGRHDHRTVGNRLTAEHNDYNHRDWSRDQAKADSPKRITDDGKVHLPFDKIEVVGAVLLYDASKDSLDRPAYTNEPSERFIDGVKVDPATGDPIDIPDAEWLVLNGTMINFSRQTGLALSGE